MKQIIRRIFKRATLLAISAFMLHLAGVSYASISNINVDYAGLGSFSPLKDYGASSTVELFSGSFAKFKLTGSWIDITSSIKLVALDGQSTTNVMISKTGNSLPGVSPAVLEFSIDKNLSGRYRVELARNGGSDNFTIRFNGMPNVNAISPLSMTGTTAYLNAFPKNSDIRIRISGSLLSNLSLKTDSRYTIVNQNYVANTAGLKEVIIKVTNATDRFSLMPGDFTIQVGAVSFDLFRLDSWTTEFEFPVYDKPNLILQGPLSNLYKKLSISSGSCSINNNVLAVIPNPTRCATTFAIANPTQTTPLTQKIVSMPAPAITIKNESFAPVGAFTVEFRFGLTVLASVPVSKMIAKEVKTISYVRPESRKLLYRSVSCPDCYEDAGVPYNWEDPNITVVIDPSPGVTTGPGVIAESNEGDNSATYTQ